jgi:AcrR family transcriptional regulator
MSEEMKKRIMEAAGQKFIQHGFSRVTMEEIAEDLGMSKKTLYQHYESKMALLKELVVYKTKECQGLMCGLCDTENMSFVEKLKKGLEFVGSLYASFNKHFVDDMRKHAPEVWKVIDEHRRKHIVEEFSELLKEGVQRGKFRSDVDLKLTTMILLTLVESLINPDKLAEMPYTAKQIFENITIVFFEGFLTEEGRAEYLQNEKAAHHLM